MRTIETTLGELVAAEQSLKAVSAVKFDQDGGVKLRYHVLKLVRLVAVETKHFHDESGAFIDKYGDGPGKGLRSTSEHWSAFVAKRKALSDIQVVIEWGPIKSSAFEPYTDVTAAMMIGLGPLIEFDDTEDAPV